MEARAFAVAASAGALASAAVCFWFTNKGTVVERPPDRRPQGDRAEAADGVLCNSPIRGPMEGFAAGSLGGADASDSSPMPSPLRNVRPKTLFGDPTDTCSEVALVDEHLRRLIKEGAFTLSDPGTDLSQYVQPASIDLPVHGPAFLVKEKVLPFKKRVRELLPSLTLEEKPLSGNGAVLLKGQTYLVYWGKVVLPPGSRGCLSPKSSIGRIDMMVRGVVDGCGLYDIVPGDGVPRELWLEISPQSFNVRLTDAIAVTQLMVFLPWARAPAARGRAGGRRGAGRGRRRAGTRGPTGRGLRRAGGAAVLRRRRATAAAAAAQGRGGAVGVRARRRADRRLRGRGDRGGG